MTVDTDAAEGPAAGPEDNPTEPDVITPVVVDLGKVKQKHVKRLKRGEGRLADEILGVLDEVVDELGDELEGATLVPVVMIYRKKPKKSRRSMMNWGW